MDAEQARADCFYTWLHSGQWAALAGRSAAEILALAGMPSEVWTLNHQGHCWLQVVYRLGVVPSAASEEERRAHAKGMELTPTLLFRDGICVSPERFEAEVPGGQTPAGSPRGIEWQPGGSFP